MQNNWKEQIDKWSVGDDVCIDATPNEIRHFISVEIIEGLIADGKKAINNLRSEQPSNIAHPDYYKSLNDWEIDEIALNEAENAIEELRAKWLGKETNAN